MSENQCPSCNNELDWEGEYVCKTCQVSYKKIGYCPD